MDNRNDKGLDLETNIALGMKNNVCVSLKHVYFEISHVRLNCSQIFQSLACELTILKHASSQFTVHVCLFHQLPIRNSSLTMGVVARYQSNQFCYLFLLCRNPIDYNPGRVS